MDVQRLKKHFHFNDADLFTNRNGRLSENQAKRILEAVRAEIKSAQESRGILLVIAAFGFSVGALIVVNAPVLSAKILIGLALCVLWPLAWGWKAWQAGRSPRMPERESPVRAARGSVRVIRQGEDVMLEVEGRQFDVEAEVAQMLAEGEQVAVYFWEETEEILSLEAL